MVEPLIDIPKEAVLIVILIGTYIVSIAVALYFALSTKDSFIKRAFLLVVLMTMLTASGNLVLGYIYFAGLILAVIKQILRTPSPPLG